jgi:hypothetical protein
MSNIVSIPHGAAALERLNLNRCNSLAAHWLPASCAAAIVDLSVIGYAQKTLPEGLQQLTDLDIAESKHLEQHWLPRSSAACIVSLCADYSNLQRLPDHLPSLEKVSVRWCHELARDWCPDRVRAHLKDVQGGNASASDFSDDQSDSSDEEDIWNTSADDASHGPHCYIGGFFYDSDGEPCSEY